MNEDEKRKFKIVVGLVAGAFAVAGGVLDPEAAIATGKRFADAADEAGMIDGLIEAVGLSELP